MQVYMHLQRQRKIFVALINQGEDEQVEQFIRTVSGNSYDKSILKTLYSCPASVR